MKCGRCRKNDAMDHSTLCRYCTHRLDIETGKSDRTRGMSQDGRLPEELVRRSEREVKAAT